MDPKYKVKFNLILEALCRKKGPVFEKTLKQIEVLNILTYISKKVKYKSKNFKNQNLFEVTFYLRIFWIILKNQKFYFL